MSGEGVVLARELPRRRGLAGAVQHLRGHDADPVAGRRARDGLASRPGARSPGPGRSSSPGRWPVRRARFADEMERMHAAQLADEDDQGRWTAMRPDLEIGGAAGVRTSGRPRSLLARRGLDPMTSSFKRQVAGQPLAQVDNPDPFAAPVWRSPVYQTPHVGDLGRAARPPRLAGVLVRVSAPAARRRRRGASVHLAQARLAGRGRPGRLGGHRACAWPTCCGRTGSPRTWSRRRGTTWRHWFYRRRWQAAMTLAGLAPSYRGRVLVPVLASVRAAGAVDLVTVRLVTGQSPRRVRRQDTQPRPRVRRAAVPGPRLRAGPGHAGVRPVRHPRRPDRRADQSARW